MAAEFTIDVDPSGSLVRMTLAGFFTPHDVAHLAIKLAEAQRGLRCAPNMHVTLVDIRAMDIQSQQSVGEFQRLLANPRTAARRIAFVVARSLARMQAKRAADGRSAAYFECPDAAERWLVAAHGDTEAAADGPPLDRVAPARAVAR